MIIILALNDHLARGDWGEFKTSSFVAGKSYRNRY